MASYTIRQGFTITQGAITFVGGESVELDENEFNLHRHKLEGDYVTVEPIFLVGNIDRINNAIADLIDSAPETLDTLKEAADAIDESVTRIEILETTLSIETYGEEAIYDPTLNMNLSRQLRTIVSGSFSLGNIGYIRGAGNYVLDNTKGMATNKGIVIISGKVGSTNTDSGKNMEIRHSPPNGSTSDIQIVFSLPIDLENNLMGFFSNQKIFIPGKRRWATFFSGTGTDNPYVEIVYREVLENLNV